MSFEEGFLIAVASQEDTRKKRDGKRKPPSTGGGCLIAVLSVTLAMFLTIVLVIIG